MKGTIFSIRVLEANVDFKNDAMSLPVLIVVGFILLLLSCAITGSGMGAYVGVPLAIVTGLVMAADSYRQKNFTQMGVCVLFILVVVVMVLVGRRGSFQIFP